MFTDTNSLCVSISNSKNVYEQIRKSTILTDEGHNVPALNYFDLSNYPSDHSIFNGMSTTKIKSMKESSKKVPGKFKDEIAGDALLEFVGLRAKSYAFKRLSRENDEIIEEKKLKGIQKYVVKTSIKFEH